MINIKYSISIITLLYLSSPMLAMDVHSSTKKTVKKKKTPATTQLQQLRFELEKYKNLNKVLQKNLQFAQIINDNSQQQIVQLKKDTKNLESDILNQKLENFQQKKMTKDTETKNHTLKQVLTTTLDENLMLKKILNQVQRYTESSVEYHGDYLAITQKQQPTKFVNYSEL